MQSEQITELMAALNAAQLIAVSAKKTSENPFFHSKYADLSTVWEALAPFREAGIVFTQCPEDSPDGYIVLDTQLTHAASGQWIRSRLKIRVGKDDPQGAGSALTYARRYALGCMSGLVTEEDDDASAASQPAKTFTQKFPAQPQAIQDIAAPVVNQAPSAGFLWKIGKDHKGESIVTIPTSYLEWFVQNGKLADHVQAASYELDRRNNQTVIAVGT